MNSQSFETDLEMAQNPVVGMIVPPAEGLVPPEPLAMYGEAVDFIAEGLGLKQLSPEGYEAVIDRVGVAAGKLAARGAQAVALMGTSLSFYKGAAFNTRLTEIIHQATGLPATTMSHSILAALATFDARKVVLGTAYAAPVNQRLRSFLTESGLAVLGTESLDLVAVEDVLKVTDADLLALGERAMTRAADADALLISCGGLQTLRVTVELEARCGLPVVSSAVAGAWGAVRLVGHSGQVAGYGRLTAP